MHRDLMVDVWELADQKAALAAQLAEIDQLHRQAIVLAHTFGVKQPALAKLSDVTPGRISQIVQSTERPEGSLEKFHREVARGLEWPADHLQHIRKERTAAEPTAWAEKFELVHGHSPTSRRPPNS